MIGRLTTLCVAGLLALAADAAEREAIALHTIPARALESNLLGDPAEIRLAVYLPPSYASSPERRYPSVYLLHGYLGSMDDFGVRQGKPGFQDMRLAPMMDEAIARGAAPEMIVVVPEGRNRYLGSFYVNSPIMGDWEDAYVRELLPWIDAHYRTVQRPAARGIAGFSMGGYGAILLAMRHPDLFGAAYGLSACCLGMVEDLGPGNPAWTTTDGSRPAVALLPDPATIDEAHPPFLTALAAALAPRPARPGEYVDVPFASAGERAQPSEPAWTTWQSRMPIYLVEQYEENLRRLNGIAFDVGAEDEYPAIRTGARMLSGELAVRGIPHGFELYAGGTHNGMIRERIETRVLPFFSRTLRLH